jgi:hypothetical protein
MHLAVGVADSQRALADEALKQLGQQTHVVVLRGRPKSP